MVKKGVEVMSKERVYGQDVVNQGAVFVSLLVKAVADIAEGRDMNEDDDLIMSLAMEWAEQYVDPGFYSDMVEH